MTRAAAAALLACLVAGCGVGTAKPKPQATKPRPPTLVASIELPGEDGRVHIVDVPTSSGIESARCVVAVSRSGAIATSCPPKDIDLTPVDE